MANSPGPGPEPLLIALEALRADNADLRARLEEAEDTLRALRQGEVDAIVVGEGLYTLEGADAASNRFRGDALAQMEDAVVATDRERRVIYLNPAAERLYRQSASDVLGRTLDSLYTQCWLTDADEAEAAATARADAFWRGQSLHRCADGAEIRVDSSVSALRDAGGSVIGTLAVMRDITAQARAEAAARQREHFVERVLAVAPGVLQVYDIAAQRNVFISSSIAGILGYRNDEFAAPGTTMAERLMHPDDLPRYRAHLAETQAAGDGEVVMFEYRMRDADGRWHWLQSRDAVFSRGASGDVRELIGIAIDITEWRAAAEELARREREFSTLVENSPDVVARMSPDLRHTYVSPAIERFSGLTPAQMIGKTNAELGMPAALCARWDEALTRVFATGHGDGIGFEFTTPAGEVRFLDARLIPEFAADGSVESVLVVATDITDRERAATLLREADRRKDEFLATLAHELRNPLAPISNSLSAMRLSAEPALRDRARSVIERQLGQLVHLVDDLLDVSRINQGKLELRREPLDIAAVVHNAVETGRPLIEGRGHRLELDLPAEPVFVDADMTRLTQVFANLLNNAAKYTREGGLIRIRAGHADGEVVISVRDSGIGVAPPLLTKIFDMFTQVDQALDRPQGGLGIGLALVRRLVDLHGGSVAARSEGVGHGLEVVVTLPAFVPAQVQPTLESTLKEGYGKVSPSPDMPAVQQRGRCKVLVADDNADNAESLAALLRLMGCEVVTAPDGLQAVTLASSFRPDIALLDLGMPVLDGNGAARRIRAEPWGEKILLIAVSGWGQPEDRRRTGAAGFDRHLVKPVEPALLEQMIEDWARS